jgi:hypothetical protein
MAITKTWKSFGDIIAANPRLTLASFLGHPPSIATARQLGVRFPVTTDFEADSAFNPNIHNLRLKEDYIKNIFLMLCISVWGAEVLKQAVNVCSSLHCQLDKECPPELKTLRDNAALALQRLIGEPSPESRRNAADVLHKCEATYRPHEDNPDSLDAKNIWAHLGAPWFGLKTALGNLNARKDCGESEPGPANSSWCIRNTVWPVRAIDAVAHWSSHEKARAAVISTLVTWATAPMSM